MHKTLAPGVTLLTEITQMAQVERKGCVSKSECACTPARGDGSLDWDISAGSEPAELTEDNSTEFSETGGDHSDSCPELRSKLSPLHSYPRKSTLEQAWVPLPADLQLQHRHSQTDSKAVARGTELDL